MKNIHSLNESDLKSFRDFPKRKELNLEEFEHLMNLKEKIYSNKFENKEDFANYGEFYEFMEDCYKINFSKKNPLYEKLREEFEKKTRLLEDEYELSNQKISAISLVHQECLNKFLDLVKIHNPDLYSSLGLINEIFNNALDSYIAKMTEMVKKWKKTHKELEKSKSLFEEHKKSTFDRTATLVQRMEQLMVENSVLSNSMTNQTNVLTKREFFERFLDPKKSDQTHSKSLNNSSRKATEKKTSSMKNSLVQKQIKFESIKSFQSGERKKVSLKEAAFLVTELMQEKIKYNQQCENLKFRYETMRNFVRIFFNNKYSTKKEVEEMLEFLENGLEQLAKKDISICLFFHIYQNAIDEEYFFIQNELKTTCKDLFKVILKKNLGVTNSNFVNEDWERKINNQEILEASEVRELVKQLCGSAQREVLLLYFKANPKFYFYNTLEFKILEFYMTKHAQYLLRSRELFFYFDKNYTGVINQVF
jgi:hypothetical protein